MVEDEKNKSVNPVIGHIEAYCAGDDYNDYMERMDSLIGLNNISEANQMQFCIGFCGPDLYKLIKSCIAPKTISDIKYAEMKLKLEAYFKPKVNIIAERFKFHSRQQKSEESVTDYIVELKALSRTCDYKEHLDQALRDQLVFGVGNERIQCALLREKELTFDLACSTAKNVELTSQNVEIMHHDNNSVSVFSRNRLGSRPNQRTQDTKKGRYANYQCYTCHEFGHTSKMCRKNQSKRATNGHSSSFTNKQVKRGRRNKVNDIEEAAGGSSEGETEDDLDLGHLNNIVSKGPVFIEVSVNGVILKMEVDTGACQSVIHRKDQLKLFPEATLSNYRASLSVITGDPVNIMGFINVNIAKITEASSVRENKLIVLDSKRNFIPLAGRTWLDILFAGWRTFFLMDFTCSSSEKLNQVINNRVQIDNFVKGIMSDYPNVFSKSATGTIKHFKIDIHLTDNAKPIFYKPYSLPYGLRDATEKELDRLIKVNTIYPVRHSKWATPIIAVQKKTTDSSVVVRLCADCKVTINKFLVKDHYPLPQIEDIFASLSGAKIFCVLDLRDAFQQIEVAESSQELLTVNTHLGLFRYRRLVFGISLAPTYFQSVMDQILKNLKGVVCFIDDVLIGGNTFNECMENLMQVVTRLNEYNVRVNRDKCKFFIEKVEYLGHVISGDGISPSLNKVKAVLNAPRPENLTQLKSYLGLINYYGKFLPNLSTVIAPLYQLTKKDVPFEWSNDCDLAFLKSKELLAHERLLVIYDPNKPLVIHCDASPYGLGAILSHIIDGLDRPIMYTSCTLSAAQKNYSQLHREALAIVFAVRRFHKYIFGKTFVIYSDHQPLREIFNEKKSTPVAAGRLQRWAIFLASYDYQIAYKKGSKLGNADALSRLPLPEDNDIEHQNIHAFADDVSIDVTTIALETAKDKVLSKIHAYVTLSWPSQLEEPYRVYFNKRLMLCAESGCLYYGNRIVIPSSLQKKALLRLHATHIGIARMKLLAKSYIWWPNINRDIEIQAKSCVACQLNQTTPSPVKLTKWKETSRFFERIHIDFFQFEQRKFLILIDTHTRWMDIKIMSNTTAAKVAATLRNIFAYFGLPEMLVADNGPPFNSAEFREFCLKNKIDYCNSPAYHPQSNGWAECAVRTAKASIKKMVTDGKTKSLPIELKVDNFLFKYRNTPVTTTNVSPNSMIFIFRTRTLISIMNNKAQSEQRTTKMNRPAIKQGKTISTKSSINTFAKHDMVVYKCESSTAVRWCRAKVIEVISPCRFRIKLLHNGTNKVCHGDQLRKFNEGEHLVVIPPKTRSISPENAHSSATSCYTTDEGDDSSSDAVYSSASELPPNTPHDQEPVTRFSSRTIGKEKPMYKETRLRKNKKK